MNLVSATFWMTSFCIGAYKVEVDAQGLKMETSIWINENKTENDSDVNHLRDEQYAEVSHYGLFVF